MNNLLKNHIIILLLMLATVISCTNNQSQHLGFVNDDGYNTADSIVSDIGDKREFNRLLVVADSLERKGKLTEVRAIFYKTIAYNILGQHNSSLRLYYNLSRIDVKKLTCKADLESYIYSYKDYVRLLCDMRRYDRALREAFAADQKLKAAGYQSFIDHQDIAQTIGESQLYLGQTNEAAHSFQKALESTENRLVNYHDPLDYRECQKTMNAIARAYIQTSKYQQAIPWIERQDSMLVAAQSHPQRDSVFIDEMIADINYSKALVAHNLGNTDEAERAFAAYQSTQMAKQLGSIINSNDYLMLTQHYDEAARNYTKLECFLKERGYKANLEVIGRYLIPKFRANLLAGHRDSALYVANLVAEYYDTALVRQKAIDADLISTIYNTEGKERQIAEQRAKLSHQRMISVAVVMGIILFFFYIYSMQRRKAYRRLDAKNRELQEANERAAESSRMKTKFIQQISHEVRTPLNVLSGFSQVLATPDIEIDSYQLQHISQKIVENSDRITKLIDKMLDLSMINSNADIERNDTVRPADIAKKAIDESDIRNAAHLELQWEVTEEAENLYIKTNQKAAVKALTLLLDNAIKFTHPLAFKGQRDSKENTRVTLHISATNSLVMFAVEDTGIGIPADQRENIFKEFVQLDEYSDGTGIGLSIARSLVRHMNGDVTLDTSYKDGARFVVTLPR